MAPKLYNLSELKKRTVYLDNQRHLKFSESSSYLLSISQAVTHIRILDFMHMSICLHALHIYHLCAWYPKRQEVGVGSPKLQL